MTAESTSTILVTGGAGYIGSHAVLALCDAGHRVVVLDNLVTGFQSAVDDRAQFIEGDIADEALVAALLRDHGVGAVLHFAGSVVVPESVSNPLKYYDNNTARSRSLIASVRAAGVPRFIFSSTAATYGMPDQMLVDETTPQRPINPYGWSKLMTEQMLSDVAAASDEAFSFAALRYFNVAGADPLGRAGQSTLGATHLIKVAVEAALGKRAGVEIFGADYSTPDGTGVRDYIHVTDLVAAHLCALDHLAAHPGRSLRLNCGYGRGFSVTEVLDTVERVSGQSIPRTLSPRREGDPAALVADARAIRAQLGWQPLHDQLETIVSHALAWERRLNR